MFHLNEFNIVYYNGTSWFPDTITEKENGERIAYYRSPDFPGEFISLTFTNNKQKRYNLPEHLFHIKE